MRYFYHCWMIGLLWLSIHAVASDFVGSQTCQQCHQPQYDAWRTSHHFHAMQPAKAPYVLGNFDNVTVNFHNLSTRFFTQNNQYLIETINAKGQSEVFTVKYTFGVYPLQQYLIELDKGHIQAFDVAWDARPAAEGGQRWFALQPQEKITPEHPFFWTRHFQNWNSRCADCHSTNVSRNYSPADNSFKTTFSEVNVGCEACHGPAATHVSLAQSGKLTPESTGFSEKLAAKIKWQFAPNDPIANPSQKSHDQQINMCAGCHSRRSEIGEKSGHYHDQYRLQLLDDGVYFADGKIQDEVFEMGSFLQSKMHEQGVVCTNCHNPHSGQLVASGNAVCTQCHLPAQYDTPKHHHHPTQSTGAQCVSCHMPERLYMEVDWRRDHSFSIPNPFLAQNVGSPSACVTCHKDKNELWAQTIFKQWNITPHNNSWAILNEKSRHFDALVSPQIIEAINDLSHPAMVRATLLQQLSAMPSSATIAAAQQHLTDKNPLVRRGAVSALSALPADMRWQILSPLINDPTQSVRMEVAANLADILAQLPEQQKPALEKLIVEYRQSLALTADSPTTQVAIANLEMALGNAAATEQAFNQALLIEPNYVPALINYSDYWRAVGHETKAGELLQKALLIAPDSASAHYAYALHLIRMKQNQQAMPHLQQAASLKEAQPNFAYAYAVGLADLGQTQQALNIIDAADQRWPHQYELLLFKVNLLTQLNQTEKIKDVVTTLKAIAPDSPEVQQLIQQYNP